MYPTSPPPTHTQSADTKYLGLRPVPNVGEEVQALIDEHATFPPQVRPSTRLDALAGTAQIAHIQAHAHPSPPAAGASSPRGHGRARLESTHPFT